MTESIRSRSRHPARLRQSPRPRPDAVFPGNTRQVADLSITAHSNHDTQPSSTRCPVSCDLNGGSPLTSSNSRGPQPQSKFLCTPHMAETRVGAQTLPQARHNPHKWPVNTADGTGIVLFRSRQAVTDSPVTHGRRADRSSDDGRFPSTQRCHGTEERNGEVCHDQHEMLTLRQHLVTRSVVLKQAIRHGQAGIPPIDLKTPFQRLRGSGELRRFGTRTASGAAIESLQEPSFSGPNLDAC